MIEFHDDELFGDDDTESDEDSDDSEYLSDEDNVDWADEEADMANCKQKTCYIY